MTAAPAKFTFDLDLGDPVGVAPGGGPEPVVDGHQEPLGGVCGVGPVRGQHQVLAVVGERHEAQGAHEGDLQLDGEVRGSGPVPRGYPRRTSPMRRHARSGARSPSS